MMFKDFFEGKNGCGTLRMMVCVNPQPDDYDENIYVMDFAEMTSKVKIKYETPIQRTLFTPGKYDIVYGRTPTLYIILTLQDKQWVMKHIAMLLEELLLTLPQSSPIQCTVQFTVLVQIGHLSD